MTAPANRFEMPLPSHPNVRKKMPTPFQRPRITVGSGRPPEKREWRIVPPADIQDGDIVPGVGRVFRVEQCLEAPRAESGLTAQEIADQTHWTVIVTGGANNTRVFDGSTTVWVYTTRMTTP